MRSFNTAGPVDAADHYLIAPLSRIDLDEVLGLVRDKKFVVLHAPRQTGKTTALLALGDFSREQTQALLGQHTEETGQAFAPEALEAVWTQTRGQPWLVNALAAAAAAASAALATRASYFCYTTRHENRSVVA